MDAQFHRFAREELVPGIDFIPTYGNTLMGLATCKPFDPADNYAIIYYPPQPRAVIELVNPENPEEACRLRRNQTGYAYDSDERIFLCHVFWNVTKQNAPNRSLNTLGTVLKTSVYSLNSKKVSL